MSRRAAAVRAELHLIEHSTGQHPLACPWWSFHDPDVAAVLRAHDCIGEDGSDELLRQFWGADPPYWLVLGVAHYHRVLKRVRGESLRLWREERKQQRGKVAKLPPGFEVEHEIRG